MVAGGGRVRGYHGGVGMRSGCHLVIPLGVPAIVRRGWGDVKKKHGRSCEPRASSREPGEERPQAARRQLRAGSGAQLSSCGLRITHHLLDLDRHASCVTRHQEPTCWPRRCCLGVRGAVVGVRGEGVRGLGGAPGPVDGTYGTNGTDGTRADRASAGAGPLAAPLFLGVFGVRSSLWRVPHAGHGDEEGEGCDGLAWRRGCGAGMPRPQRGRLSDDGDARPTMDSRTGCGGRRG